MHDGQGKPPSAGLWSAQLGKDQGEITKICFGEKERTVVSKDQNT